VTEEPPSATPPTDEAPEPQLAVLSPLESGALLLLALALLKGIEFAPLGGVAQLLTPTLIVLAWALPAWALISSRDRDPLEELALVGKPLCLLSSLGPAIAGLGLFALGIGLILGWPEDVPATSALASLMVFQLLAVALPEEIFFRGVVQGSLERRGPLIAIGGAALAFALAHVLFEFSPRRFEVFVPGLVFGWLRWRCKSLWPSVVFHALCNLVQALLLSGP